jgi:glutamine synthetase
LPSTLLDAVRAFETDSLVTEVLGESFQRIYAEQKHKEWSRGFYRVSEEERAEMLTYL